MDHDLQTEAIFFLTKTVFEREDVILDIDFEGSIRIQREINFDGDCIQAMNLTSRVTGIAYEIGENKCVNALRNKNFKFLCKIEFTINFDPDMNDGIAFVPILAEMYPATAAAREIQKEAVKVSISEKFFTS